MMALATEAGHTRQMGRVLDVAPHLAALALGVIVSVLAGQPFGWIGFLLPAGPLLFLVPDRSRTGARHALAFALVAAAMIGGGWAITELRSVTSVAAWLFPFGLLVFLLGLVNFVLVSCSRAHRAWTGATLNYPWIPDRLAQALRLDMRMY